MFVLSLSLALAEPLDRVLFIVGERIVTQSDVAFETFFDAHDQSPVPAFEDSSTPLPDRLRDMAVIRQLAGDVSVFRPSAAEVRTRAEAFLAHWPRADDGLADLRDWGLDEQAFMGHLYSRMVVEKYVLRSVAVPLESQDDAEIVAWRLRFAAWIADLRGRADVREATIP